MSLSKIQIGAVGEGLVSFLAVVGSDGDIELFRPETDDDEVDLVGGRKAEPPKIALQVKTTLTLTRHGLVHATSTPHRGRHRDHPSFIYVIVWIDGISARCLWVVPSPDFNRIARHEKSGELAFNASPDRGGPWSEFQLVPSALGPRLLAAIDALPEGFRLADWDEGG